VSGPTTVVGMVLSAMPIGDYDKRLVILTKERGKISAFAKGARKPNSAFLACSQPFSFGEFTLYEGRSSYNILSVEIANYFAELRDDIESVYYGLYFCEFTDYLTKENDDEKDILKLLYQSLRVIGKKTIDLTLIRAIFELKMIALNGEAPQVFHCVKCGGTAEAYSFSVGCGGLLCRSCHANDPGAVKLSTSTIYAMQYIISAEIEKLYTFTVTKAVLNELCYCVKRYRECYVEHEFKAIELIQTL